MSRKVETNGTRSFTNALIEDAEEGIISWEAIARACMDYMSESEVRDMAESEFDYEEDTEDEDEDYDGEDEDEGEYEEDEDGSVVIDVTESKRKIGVFRNGMLIELFDNFADASDYAEERGMDDEVSIEEPTAEELEEFYDSHPDYLPESTDSKSWLNTVKTKAFALYDLLGDLPDGLNDDAIQAANNMKYNISDDYEILENSIG